MPAKSDTSGYTVLVEGGLDYGADASKHADQGAVVTDLPTESLDWLTSQGLIAPVGGQPAPEPVELPVVDVSVAGLPDVGDYLNPIVDTDLTAMPPADPPVEISGLPSEVPLDIVPDPAPLISGLPVEAHGDPTAVPPADQVPDETPAEPDPAPETPAPADAPVEDAPAEPTPDPAPADPAPDATEHTDDTQES